VVAFRGETRALSRPSAPRAQAQAQQSQQQPPPTPPPSSPAPPQAPASQVPTPIPTPPAHVGPIVVLDPGHGGTDTGARGQSGAIEKDVVLQYAMVVRGELESQGFRVVLTRTDDSNPSYDDRAAIANAYRDAVFVSLHVASSGTAGTARAYYYQFGSEPSGSPAVTAGVTATSGTAAPPAAPTPAPAAAAPTVPSLTVWELAQEPYEVTSHVLADALQAQLAQRFSGSPATPAGVAIRELRSVSEPAVAIEVSSVSVADPSSLQAMAAPLAVAIARGLQAFESSHPAGGD